MSTLIKLLDGYGSFFALSHPLSKILILVAALLQPHSGFIGLLGGLSVIMWRRILQFDSESERIEIINGILLGSLMGSLYASNYVDIILTISGALLVVLFSAIFSDTIGKQFKLPLLGTPYAMVSFALLPICSMWHLIPTHAANPYTVPAEFSILNLLNPLGAMYFNGTVPGGILVLVAFCLSSRYLALLAVGACICSYGFLSLLGVYPDSIISLVARMNSVLSACILGGLFAVPGKRSLMVSMGAAILSCVLALSLTQLLAVVSLPVLALPFVLSLYLCLLCFNSQRGKSWTYFWLTVPSLPEQSLAQMHVAKVRGIDPRSVALHLPLRGIWQIYQGFGGKHTHKGIWQYAIDFFQTSSGVSFSGNGRNLCDYHAYGKPVLSPALGTVVDLRADVPDNPPGEVDTVNNWGNYILIRLDCGYYVLLAHLQPLSIRVVNGSRVYPGEALALVGNSGRSPQPHLHMHVQEDHILGSKTIPFHLSNVIVHEKERDNFSLNSTPHENELLSAPTKNAALKRALKFTVGSKFQFEVKIPDQPVKIEVLNVTLDLAGQFWIESSSGASVAFTLTDDLLAFFNRRGPEDPFLDAFILTLGLTPFAEGRLNWIDATPKKLLPMSLMDHLASAIVSPLQECAQSNYSRFWDPFLRVWTQTAQHKLGRWACAARANFCESRGLVDFELSEGKQSLLKARLLRSGIKEDNGIPASTAIPLNQVSDIEISKC